MLINLKKIILIINLKKYIEIVKIVIFLFFKINFKFNIYQSPNKLFLKIDIFLKDSLLAANFSFDNFFGLANSFLILSSYIYGYYILFYYWETFSLIFLSA